MKHSLIALIIRVVLINLCIIQFAFFSFNAAYATQGADSAALKKYAKNLIMQGYNIIKDTKLSPALKVRKSARLIRGHLYLDWMAKYTLGRHRRTLDQKKIDEFVSIYSRFIVQIYSDLFVHYNGQQVEITKVHQLDDDLFIINMKILSQKSQNPIKIDYLVHKLENNTKDPYRIGDIVTEGISILNAQQAEFNNIIVTQGIDALIENLKQHIHKK